ncbi:MAG: substrate-binding domain-containing protein [Pseudomonadota bacterium]
MLKKGLAFTTGIFAFLVISTASFAQTQQEIIVSAGVFASASQKEMDELEKSDKIPKETKVDFAGNEVVLIVPVDASVQIKSFADLQKPEIKKIALGNAQTVPAGRYADEVLMYYKLKDAITLEKCIFGKK